MANYYAAARTNYFRVKDEQAFRKWAGDLSCEICDDQEGRFCLLPGEYTDDGTFPSCRFDENNDGVDFEFEEELAQHLQPGSVAIIMESGAEKLRYVHGHAIAIRSDGKQVSLSLRDIYDKAEKELEGEVTAAEY